MEGLWRAQGELTSLLCWKWRICLESKLDQAFSGCLTGIRRRLEHGFHSLEQEVTWGYRIVIGHPEVPFPHTIEVLFRPAPRRVHFGMRETRSAKYRLEARGPRRYQPWCYQAWARAMLHQPVFPTDKHPVSALMYRVVRGASTPYGGFLE